MHLEKDFDAIYIVDLTGNVRRNPKLSGTTHNVFGIQVGVSINFFVKLSNEPGQPKKQLIPPIYYARSGELWRKEEKCNYLENHQNLDSFEWQMLQPNKHHIWLNAGI